MPFRPVSLIKSLFVPAGKRPRRILTGAFKGLVMDLDLRAETQTLFGLYEQEIQRWLDRHARGIRTVVDVGAGHGMYVLYALRLPEIQSVLAFEPWIERHGTIARNLALNPGLPQAPLKLFPTALGAADRDGAMRLDGYAGQISFPCLVKIDVDGSETAVLSGAAGLLARDDVSWLIETHTLALEKECIRVLERAGYRTRVIYNAWWRVFLPELREGPLGNHNRWLVATRPEGR